MAAQKFDMELEPRSGLSFNNKDGLAGACGAARPSGVCGKNKC